MWFELPEIPPLSPNLNVIKHVQPPAIHDRGDGGGTRDEHIEPRLLLRERGRRSSKLSFGGPLFNKPNSSKHVVDGLRLAGRKTQLGLDSRQMDLQSICSE